MPDFLINTLIIVLSGLFFPAVPVIIIAAYRAGHTKKLFEITDKLQKDKVDKADFQAAEVRLHKIELSSAENNGRLAASIDRLESIERRLEKKLGQGE